MLEDSGDEEESAGIVNQVLDEIGIEVSGKVIIANPSFSVLLCSIRLSLCFQMRGAPSAIQDSIGSTGPKMTEKDIAAQLAKLRST